MFSHNTGRTVEQLTSVKEHFFFPTVNVFARGCCLRVYTYTTNMVCLMCYRTEMYIPNEINAICFQLCIKENLLHHEICFYGE